MSHKYQKSCFDYTIPKLQWNIYQAPSYQEARQVDTVSYLSSLWYEPAKIRNCNYWYLSFFRSEKTPSFKINRKLNRWYDYGIGKGGSLIDFAILYNDCTVREFLQTLNGSFSFHRPTKAASNNEFQETESRIIIVKEKPLTSFILHRFLYQRRIPIDVAKQFCKEVIYSSHGKEYFAIGFKNNAGGYELRNSFFNGSSSPKDVTTISNNAKPGTNSNRFYYPELCFLLWKSPPFHGAIRGNSSLFRQR